MNTPTFNNNNYNNNNNNNKKTQERFLILRAIRYKNKFMAIIIINSYDIKIKSNQCLPNRQPLLYDMINIKA